ncbi:hypothetical protein JM18_008081 [Phytophthora kernoviae]|uniref:PH domain-containing protein n=2 Tax=Phytophthora kernoviae TaxID=325452 RepID=A0A921S967_9STRA|nr:hypothetical protein G195_009924 [Phytophthora kernoviae 00238/432]KAG2510586.1 hypothetical protein JM18_008081 [Phytophthora kernoviae]
MTSPFDRHLIDIYAGRAPDGLVFFSEHGYYDVSDTTNTVQMFRDNVGRDDFWHDRESYDDFDPFERPTVYPFGSQSKVPSSRMRSELHRTNSGRFTLLDDDGNPVSEDDLLEMEREDRLKVKSLELDDDDLAELESEQATVESAIEVIRVEKYRFQRVLFRAFYEPENATKVEMMGHGGFRMEFKGGNLLVMRSRNEKEAACWAHLLRLALQIMRGNATRCSEISRLTNG